MIYRYLLCFIQVMYILLQIAGHPIIFCYKITHHHMFMCQWVSVSGYAALYGKLWISVGSQRGWRSLTGIPDAGCWGCLDDHPLQDAGVFPTGGDQMTVIMQKGNVGHMTAVTAILVAWSLRESVKIGKVQNHFPARFRKTPELSKYFQAFKYLRPTPSSSLWFSHKMSVNELDSSGVYLEVLIQTSLMMGSSPSVQLIELRSSLQFELSTLLC